MMLQGDPYLPADLPGMRRQLTLLWRQLADWSASVSGNYATVKLDANQSIPTSAATAISFSSVVSSSGTWWLSGDPTRLTVPPGVNSVLLTAGVSWASNATGYRQARLTMNGASVAAGFNDRRLAVSAAATECSVSSGVIAVVPGDYFELVVAQTSGGSLDATTAVSGTWMSIRAVS